ncbi:hypothetical protein BJ508DRAFT_164160 [Ascobolus immersus RN42]|uniref:Uncharacterized protein n=1 Tax=Ascobolus immersus RN42 TaxID=1160509 RepID=A0A3N4HVP3_ASCIM|nr:hypothetical protein BJ508DRAFT_164160 [Ascobolus immersus RN42]
MNFQQDLQSTGMSMDMQQGSALDDVNGLAANVFNGMEEVLQENVPGQGMDWRASSYRNLDHFDIIEQDQLRLGDHEAPSLIREGPIIFFIDTEGEDIIGLQNQERTSSIYLSTAPSALEFEETFGNGHGRSWRGKEKLDEMSMNHHGTHPTDTQLGRHRDIGTPSIAEDAGGIHEHRSQQTQLQLEQGQPPESSVAIVLNFEQPFIPSQPTGTEYATLSIDNSVLPMLLPEPTASIPTTDLLWDRFWRRFWRLVAHYSYFGLLHALPEAEQAVEAHLTANAVKAAKDDRAIRKKQDRYQLNPPFTACF